MGGMLWSGVLTTGSDGNIVRKDETHDEEREQLVEDVGWNTDEPGWYYRDLYGTEQGPFGRSQLEEWAASGMLDPTSLLVREEGTEQWGVMGGMLWSGVLTTG